MTSKIKFIAYAEMKGIDIATTNASVTWIDYVLNAVAANKSQLMSEYFL